MEIESPQMVEGVQVFGIVVESPFLRLNGFQSTLCLGQDITQLGPEQSVIRLSLKGSAKVVLCPDVLSPPFGDDSQVGQVDGQIQV